MQYPTIMQPTAVRIEQIPPSAAASTDNASLVFPMLSPSIPRNFTVTDTYYENPPAGISAASYDARAYKAAGGDDFLAPFRGLSAVSDDVKDALPAECRKAFDEALAREKNWHDVRIPSPLFHNRLGGFCVCQDCTLNYPPGLLENLMP